MYFLVKFEKPQKSQRSWKKSEKKAKVFMKKPISQGRIEKPKILGENSRSGNAGLHGVLTTV